MPNKYLTSLAALVLLLVAALSCTEEETYGPSYEVLEAVLEQVPHSTKADVQDSGAFSWNADDCIAVHYVSGELSYDTYHKATLTSGAGSVTATFTSRKGGERSGYAVYPYGAADVSNPGTGTSSLGIRLPENYDIDVTEPLSMDSAVPMVAVNEPGGELLFRHVAAMFRLKLASLPENTRYITVEADRNIAGPFRVDLSDASAPFVSLSSSSSPEDYTKVTYTLSSPVSGGTPASLMLNLPVPTGLYFNLCLTALDESGKKIGCINSGMDRLMERGRIRMLELSFAGNRRLSSFSAAPLSLPVCGRAPLSLSLTQIASTGGTETASGYTLSVLSISDRSIVAANVAGGTVNVTGLKKGTVTIRLLATKGEDIIYEDVPVTVTPAKLDIYYHSSHLYKSRLANLRARLVSDSKDVSYNGLKYRWSIVEGASLATLKGSGATVTLSSGISLGKVKVRCSVSPLDPEDPSVSLAAEVEIDIREYPNGTTGGLFSISNAYASEITQVCFANGNVYKKKSDGRYYLFTKPWDAYNGVVTSEEPEDADIMDCIDPKDVITDFGSYKTSKPIWVGAEETENWFALSGSQARYLLRTRKASTVGTTSNARFVVARVADSFGVILFPDVFVWPEELPVPQGINDLKSSAFDMAGKGMDGIPASNRFTEEEWDLYLGPTGAVFLPGMSSAPTFFSYDRYSDSGIASGNKRWHNQGRGWYNNDTERIGALFAYRDENGYYPMYHCYYLSGGYMYFCNQLRTDDTYYISDGTGANSYMVYDVGIDWVRYFHLRPVRFEYNKVVN